MYHPQLIYLTSPPTTVSNTPSATSRADQSTSVTTDVPPPTS